MSKPRIAIIGAGIAGLTVARKIHQDFDIKVFESNDYIGGHTHTEFVERSGKVYPVNTGFIVYNDRVYKNFNELLEPLNISRQATEMSFSVSHESGGIEYNGHNLNTLFAQRRNLFSLSFHRMIRDILRFNKQSINDLEHGKLPESLTLGDYLIENRYSKAFIDQYIIPMGSAIWSSGEADMMKFPALFFVRFFNNHGLLSIKNRPQWYTLVNGSSSYIKPLIRPFEDRVETGADITSVIRRADGVTLVMANGTREQFDEVVFACHSDQALALLEQPTQQEKSILGAIPYAQNDVTLHTDEKLLPKNKRAWAAWNYHLSADKDQPAGLTYNMNILQNFNDAPVTFCVTLNRNSMIDPDKIISQYQYAHPVFSLGSLDAQKRYYEIGNSNRTHFCGAYWFDGFHEDGVNSGLRVAKDLMTRLGELDKDVQASHRAHQIAWA
jgi:predicted NAD/FAD-binding protein